MITKTESLHFDIHHTLFTISWSLSGIQQTEITSVFLVKTLKAQTLSIQTMSKNELSAANVELANELIENEKSEKADTRKYPNKNQNKMKIHII